MKSVVLNASLAQALVLPDESSARAERLLRAIAASKLVLLTTALWPLEVADGLLGASRRERISAADRLIACEFRVGLPVTVVGEYAPIADLFALSDRDLLSINDASYLALAMQRGAVVATADGPLRRAARRRGVLWGERA